jgi:hypothetical protein
VGSEMCNRDRFGLESLSQGIPCVTYAHAVNMKCWDLLNVPPPPFFWCKYGGEDVPEILSRIFKMPRDEWQCYSKVARDWMETHYAPRKIVGRWDGVYDRIENKGRI